MIMKLLYLMRPQEVCRCVSVCLSATVIFYFPDFIPEKGNTQHTCIFGGELRFSSPPDAIGFPLARK